MCKARQNLDSKCLEYEDSPRRRRQDPPIFYILGKHIPLTTDWFYVDFQSPVGYKYLGHAMKVPLPGSTSPGGSD